MPQIRAHLPELSVRKCPRRHASVSDAVLEVIKQLAVAQSLYINAAQIWRPWILAAADLGPSAAVIGMANFALLGVYLMTRLDVSACGLHNERIFHCSKPGWDGVVHEPLRDVCLERWCILTSARALPLDECV